MLSNFIGLVTMLYTHTVYINIITVGLMTRHTASWELLRESLYPVSFASLPVFDWQLFGRGTGLVTNENLIEGEFLCSLNHVSPFVFS
jgi:hypothetical protein